jgi:hypothetical protein
LAKPAASEISVKQLSSLVKKLIEIVYDLLIELRTGTLFSFPADWRRQILKIVLVLELVLVLDG